MLSTGTRITLIALPAFLLFIHTDSFSLEARTDDGKVVILDESSHTWKYKDVAPTPTEDTAKGLKFRNAEWGSTRDEIKKLENSTPFFDKDSILVFKDTLSGMQVEAAYIFHEGKLSRGKYLIRQEHTNKSDYLSDFDSIEKLLIGKYGKPADTKRFWTNDLYKSNPTEHGMAISVGHHAIFTHWESGDTKIIHSIRGDNFKISHSIEYSNTKYSSLEKESKDKSAKEKL